MQIKRTISYKIYEISLFVTAVLCLLNILGIWLTWCLGNPFGYISGSLLIVSLIVNGVLAFLNERENIRKFWILWAIMFALHLTFFIICACLVDQSTKGNVVPALFTVLVVCIMGGILYAIFRKRFINKNKPYKLAPTTVVEDGKPENVGAGEVIQPTARIKIEEDENKKPAPVYEQPVKKTEDKSDEDETPTVSTGVITL